MTNWLYRVDVSDVFHDDDLSLVQKRDVIVERLRSLRLDGDVNWVGLLDELALVDSTGYFDAVWDHVYDWADAHRLWINTWATV